MNEEIKIIIAIILAGGLGYYFGKRNTLSFPTEIPSDLNSVQFIIPISWTDAQAKEKIDGYYNLRPVPSVSAIQGFINKFIQPGDFVSPTKAYNYTYKTPKTT